MMGDDWRFWQFHDMWFSRLVWFVVLALGPRLLWRIIPFGDWVCSGDIARARRVLDEYFASGKIDLADYEAYVKALPR